MIPIVERRGERKGAPDFWSRLEEKERKKKKGPVIWKQKNTNMYQEREGAQRKGVSDVHTFKDSHL